MTLRIRLMLRWKFFALPLQMRHCRRSASATIVTFAVIQPGSSVDRLAAVGCVCCKRIAILNHSRIRGFGMLTLPRDSGEVRTAVGESGHRGVVVPADGFDGSPEQRGDTPSAAQIM
jgi:hypothetical protein